jgi:hypothetical protein
MSQSDIETEDRRSVITDAAFMIACAIIVALPIIF